MGHGTDDNKFTLKPYRIFINHQFYVNLSVAYRDSSPSIMRVSYNYFLTLSPIHYTFHLRCTFTINSVGVHSDLSSTTLLRILFGTPPVPSALCSPIRCRPRGRPQFCVCYTMWMESSHASRCIFVPVRCG